ncbi:MAG: serine--tRNA ligase [Candidatus Tectomicrobia bacterium]|uniref:Serine--tRNA ligase n=1 Tax=Tectimicrobiota bacterium TaxID=2528274 RepID=A0A933LR08_UNCTE|nr:serine--tRNA ligase [Candidatus Tectomicrobia bacterium]
MLDIRYIRDDAPILAKALEKRGAEYPLEELTNMDIEKRGLQSELDTLRHQKKVISKSIGQKIREGGPGWDRDKEQIKIISARISELEQNTDALEKEIDQKLLEIPNIPHESVPLGVSSEDNTEIRRWGEAKNFPFKVRDHVEIGEKLGILDFRRAAKLSGARFVLYSGLGALLERALINFMLDLHTKSHGYIEFLPPVMVNRETMTGTGQLPKFEEDSFKVENGAYYLIPTAEVPITNIHRDEILEAKDLPKYYVAYTPCFRREAGSYGKDTRGLIRQHQFNKVELVKLVEPETSYRELESLVKDAEDVLKGLGLPYRVVVLCTGDLGFSAAKTYDLEIWVPSQNMYREISSCSNCEDFQTRRMKIRYKKTPNSKPELVHSLNGSGLAVGRTVVGILENYQQEDGSVLIPEMLRPYLGGVDCIRPH